MLPCPILSCPALCCPILSYPLSYPVLYPILSSSYFSPVDLYLPEHLYERDDDSEDDLRIHADPTTITAASSSAAAMPVTSRRTSLPTLEENRVPTYAQSRQRVSTWLRS